MGTIITEYDVAVDLIGRERLRQNQKWGEQNHDAYRWLAILSEEVGELAQAALHDEFGGRAAGTLEKELVHVAAVAVQWIECIERSNSAVSHACRVNYHQECTNPTTCYCPCHKERSMP